LQSHNCLPDSENAGHSERILRLTDHRRLLAGLSVIVSVYLLLIQVTGPVWALPATILYTLYLLFLLTVSVRRLSRRPTTPPLVIVLWFGLAAMLVIAAYVPSSWNLWHRGLLVVAVGLSGMNINRRDVTCYVPTRIQQNLMTVAITLVLTVFVTYGIDRAIGMLDGERRPGGLIFPRGTVVTYDTPEFTHSVHINTYGFRGPDFDLSANVDCRVMLLGDSFTYGWGVDYEQTWGALIEAALLEEGHSVQFMNLGVPGGNTADYAAIAATTVPALQPDVILVGVLQGDEMRQVSRDAGVFPRSLTFGESDTRSPITEYVTFHYPFIAERTLLRYVSAATIQQTWSATAAAFRAEHGDERRARYDALPVTIRMDFEAGRVSPHFIQLGVIAPDYWLWPLQPVDTLDPYIDRMATHFQQIAAAAPNTTLQVVSIPHGAYTQSQAQADLVALGFNVPPDLLTNTFVDGAIADAAERAELPYVSVTDAFRTHDTLAFYPVDGHFNVEGNRLLAETLLPTVREACE
jgi:hypothetical protein